MRDSHLLGNLFCLVYLKGRFWGRGCLSSICRILQFGVPKWSVLGPLLDSLYTTPLSDIASEHGLSFHFYADDMQLYVTSETSFLNDMEMCKCMLEDCVREIDT